MLGVGGVKKFVPMVSDIVEFSMDCWGTLNDMADQKNPQMMCDFVAEYKDLSAIKL